MALRRIARVPSSVSAWRSERTRVAGLSAAELLRRSSRWLRPRSHSMIVSSSSMSTSAAGLEQAAERRDLRRRQRAPVDERRAGEVVALEGVEAECLAVLGLLVGLHLLGHEPQAAALQHRRVVREALRRERAHVELGDRRQLEQRLLLGRVLEVVERDREAGVDQRPQGVEQGTVELLVLEQLEHDPFGRQRQRRHAEQELARDVHVGRMRADERVEADVREAVDDHRRRRGHRVQRAAVDRDRPVQQLVGDHALLTVEDRLSSQQHPFVDRPFAHVLLIGSCRAKLIRRLDESRSVPVRTSTAPAAPTSPSGSSAGGSRARSMTAPSSGAVISTSRPARQPSRMPGPERSASSPEANRLKATPTRTEGKTRPPR